VESLKDSIKKFLDVPNTLGAVILVAWLVMKFLHFQTDASLDNVVMIVVGYIWGSSAGSKAKDLKSPVDTAAVIPPPAA
jgi:hypothetical protein